MNRNRNRMSDGYISRYNVRQIEIEIVGSI